MKKFFNKPKTDRAERSLADRTVLFAMAVVDGAVATFSRNAMHWN